VSDKYTGASFWRCERCRTETPIPEGWLMRPIQAIDEACSCPHCGKSLTFREAFALVETKKNARPRP